MFLLLYTERDYVNFVLILWMFGEILQWNYLGLEIFFGGGELFNYKFNSFNYKFN